jgi:hypothetical protein
MTTWGVFQQPDDAEKVSRMSSDRSEESAFRENQREKQISR